MGPLAKVSVTRWMVVLWRWRSWLQLMGSVLGRAAEPDVEGGRRALIGDGAHDEVTSRRLGMAELTGEVSLDAGRRAAGLHREHGDVVVRVLVRDDDRRRRGDGDRRMASAPTLIRRRRRRGDMCGSFAFAVGLFRP